MQWAINESYALDANVTLAEHEYAFNRMSQGEMNSKALPMAMIWIAPPRPCNARLTHQTSTRLQSALTWHHVGSFLWMRQTLKNMTAMIYST
jgi:hypothetical protein